MDSVPILFIESVSASLSRESLENLKGCRSAVWQVGAERIWTVMKEMQIEVSVPLQNHPSLYSYAIQQHSLDDLRRTKYARIDMALSPWPQDPGEASSVEGLKSLFTYANALNVESLDIVVAKNSAIEPSAETTCQMDYRGREKRRPGGGSIPPIIHAPEAFGDSFVWQ
uniref:FBA_2 domain-containing protein n=1 Tax=Steinernema glaseri TaxID=37863 RepID=A0A1I7YFJ3_9BILA